MEAGMERREFLRTAGAGILGLALSRAPVWGEQEPGVRRNVLFIAVDDMNDWIGPLGGNPQARTPNLSRLAERGVTFTCACTGAAACHPSRTAIMTGVRPTTSGIVDNVFHETPGPSWRQSPALAKAVTLSQHFRNHGYSAVGGGKIYHALQWGPWSENDPDTWDEYYPRWDTPIPTQPRPSEEQILEQGKTFFGSRPLGNGALFGWTPLSVTDSEMSDFKVVDWAAAQLQKQHDKPFFLAAGVFRPHIPWEVPRKYYEMYPLDLIQLPKVQQDDLDDTWDHGRRNWHQWVLQNDQWKQAVQGYLASITFADAQIGRLLDALDRSAYRDNTIVVLWSDHGMHIGEKENWEKFTVWEESCRVPMFWVVPGLTRPGTRCDKPVSLLDIYPTLAALTGTEAPSQQLEGESLAPLLQDPANGSHIQPAITTYQRAHGLRTARWRYIFYADGSNLEELYDHSSDPDEFTNVAYDPACRDVLDEHRALLTKYTGVKTPAGKPVPPPEFALLENGRIRRTHFVRLDDVVKQAVEANKRGAAIPDINAIIRQNRRRSERPTQ
jgi:arylsulfatase A-like enzyme